MIAHVHVILLVEDDLAIAVAVIPLLQAHGFFIIHVTSFEEAREHVDAGDFCVMIVDLGILPQKGASKPEIELGYALIEYTRARFPRRGDDDMHLLGIVVLSGHNEHRYTRDAFRRGVDDFLKKPLSDNAVSLKDVILECLRKSGRADHAACADVTERARGQASSPPPVLAAASSRVRLSVTGRTEGRQCEVAINDVPVLLPLRKFTALVALIVGRAHGVEWVEHDTFGKDNAYKALSELQQALRPYLPPGVRVSKNNRSQGYSLTEDIAVDAVHAEPLAKHDDAQVRQLAASLLAKSARPAKARRA